MSHRGNVPAPRTQAILSLATNVVRQMRRTSKPCALQAKPIPSGRRIATDSVRSVARLAFTGKARRVARSIVAYLSEHPEAKDSLEGMRWWIERTDECSDTDISDAIRVLLDRGLLSRWEATPGSVVFGLSPEFLVHPERALHEFDSMETERKQ